MHNANRATAPDISGNLERTSAVASTAARWLDDVHPAGRGTHLDALLADIAAAVTHHGARSGAGRSLPTTVITAAADSAAATLDRHINALAAALADQLAAQPAAQPLPVAALRTRAGWNAALAADGHTTTPSTGPAPYGDLVDRIGTLPGTRTVLAVAALSAAVDAHRTARDGTLTGQLTGIWDTHRTTGRTFDTIIDAAGDHCEKLAEAGWALIGAESHKHINLIWHQANKLHRSFPDHDADELLTWGWMGLRTALRNYDPSLGFAFSTYACTRIVGAIRDGIRAEHPVPKRLLTFGRKVAAVEAELNIVLGRNPTQTELGAALGVEPGNLDILHRLKTPASIDEIVDGGQRGDGHEPGWLAADDDPAASAVGGTDLDTILAALDRLPAEEAEAVRLLILEDRTPTEARRIAGVTARQLRQRRDRALASLRNELADFDPDHN